MAAGTAPAPAGSDYGFTATLTHTAHHPSNPQVIRPVYSGFSWTSMFFTCVPPLFRGDWAGSLIILTVAIVVSGGALLTQGSGTWVANACGWLAVAIWGAVYNANHRDRLLRKGWVLTPVGAHGDHPEITRVKWVVPVIAGVLILNAVGIGMIIASQAALTAAINSVDQGGIAPDDTYGGIESDADPYALDDPYAMEDPYYEDFDSDLPSDDEVEALEARTVERVAEIVNAGGSTYEVPEDGVFDCIAPWYYTGVWTEADFEAHAQCVAAL